MKDVIHSDAAPKAIGPYSQAVVTRPGEFIFTSGQIPLHPQTGVLVEGDITAQTQQVMANLAAVLLAAGADFSDVVKSTIFLTDLGDFLKVNAVYETHFPSAPPARSTVQVAALPRGAKVEIEMVAVRS